MSGSNAGNQARQSKNDGDYKTALSMQDIASLLRYWSHFEGTTGKLYHPMFSRSDRCHMLISRHKVTFIDI